jgi:hypothetical protein
MKASNEKVTGKPTQLVHIMEYGSCGYVVGILLPFLQVTNEYPLAIRHSLRTGRSPLKL